MTPLIELKRQGATLVDPADITTLDQLDGSEEQVLLTELKADLNAYLAKLGDSSSVHTLQDIIDFNQRYAQQEMPYFEQDLFIKAQGKRGTGQQGISGCPREEQEPDGCAGD